MKNLDKYEKQILLTYGKGQLVSTAPAEEEKKLFMAAAKATAIPYRGNNEHATNRNRKSP